MTKHTLLDEINRQHQTRYRLAGRLAGGRQDGADLLIDDAGGPQAVLKGAWAPSAPAAIRRLRAAGYPTPAWLCWGTAPDGEQYLVQEFVAGEPMPRLTPGYLEQILALNRLQAGGNPDPGQRAGSWSEYAANVVFANESGWADRLRGHSPASAALMEAVDRLVAPHRGHALPAGDIVHGDFNRDNILVADGRITAVIDASFAGHGTRAIDLAGLLHFAYVHDEDAAIRGRLHAELLAIDGRAGRAVCLAYRIVTMAGWALDHMPPASAGDFVRAGRRIADDLRADGESGDLRKV
ncbi:MAG TPA: phosphotransferase [Herpetosiphonaceae bacterium]|nr:phosphotransferase [Herpetosiphonaceae bacterium]